MSKTLASCNDLLKDEKGEDTYVLINPKNDDIKAFILRAQDLSYYLNRVHLDMLGIEVTEEEEEDYYFYEQNHYCPVKVPDDYYKV